MPDKYKPPYQFSTQIGAACVRKFRTFPDLAKKLKMPVEDLMRQCNGKVSPSKALVKGLAKELDMDESYLDKLADEVRKDPGGKVTASSISKPSDPAPWRNIALLALTNAAYRLVPVREKWAQLSLGWATLSDLSELTHSSP
jgi:hypothetical protein